MKVHEIKLTSEELQTVRSALMRYISYHEGLADKMTAFEDRTKILGLADRAFHIYAKLKYVK